MTERHITFIGAGKLASSLIGGLLSAGYSVDALSATHPKAERREHIESLFGIQTSEDNNAFIHKADAVVLAVKPHVLPAVLLDIGDDIRTHKPLVISLAAGVRLPKLTKMLGEDVPVVRCMPNTPALVSSGASGLVAADGVAEDLCDLAESIMRAVGVSVWVRDEHELDVVTVLSGGGPAYVFLLMQAFEKAAAKAGLADNKAHLLFTQTVLGSAHLAMETQLAYDDLIKQVASKGGTTEQALAVLQDAKIDTLIDNAVEAALTRAQQLAKED